MSHSPLTTIQKVAKRRGVSAGGALVAAGNSGSLAHRSRRQSLTNGRRSLRGSGALAGVYSVAGAAGVHRGPRREIRRAVEGGRPCAIVTGRALSRLKCRPRGMWSSPGLRGGEGGCGPPPGMRPGVGAEETPPGPTHTYGCGTTMDATGGKGTIIGSDVVFENS